MKKKKVWIYCRTAYPDANEVELKKQKELLEVYAKETDLCVKGTTMICCSGHNYSSLKEVFKLLVENDCRLLLITTISRLGRDFIKVSNFIDWMNQHNLSLICLDNSHLNFGMVNTSLLNKLTV